MIYRSLSYSFRPLLPTYFLRYLKSNYTYLSVYKWNREVYTVDNEGKIWKLGKDNSDPSLLVE